MKIRAIWSLFMMKSNHPKKKIKLEGGYKQPTLLSYFNRSEPSGDPPSLASCSQQRFTSRMDEDSMQAEESSKPDDSNFPAEDEVDNHEVKNVKLGHTSQQNVKICESIVHGCSIQQPEASHIRDDLGISLTDLRKFSQESKFRLKADLLERHTIFIKTPIEKGCAPIQLDGYMDVWDDRHVKLPSSSKNLYPYGEGELKNRWSLIESALLNSFTTSYDIEEAILSYNSRYGDKWDFSNLHAVFENLLTHQEKQNFFQTVLPSVVQLSLSLPQLIPLGIPLLRAGIPHSLTFSQLQIASIVANAFFCTFPRRNATYKNSEYSNYPTINMNGMFASSVHPKKPKNRDSSIQQKLRCLLNYFTRISQTVPTGCVTFKRKVVPGLSASDWSSSRVLLSPCLFTSDKLIEDVEGLIHVDFANCRVGGGVLKTGCVQEEIMFIVHPELIASRLFTEKLNDDEVLIVKGAERYCNYAGYADTFKFVGDYKDNTATDHMGRRFKKVILMDATKYFNPLLQYSESALLRELNKAHCGFHSKNPKPIAIATGNWGCGAFKGDHRLKALIQLMAASVFGRELLYSTFSDRTLQQELHVFHTYCSNEKITVGDLWSYMVSYHENVIAGNKRASINIFDYIRSKRKSTANTTTTF